MASKQRKCSGGAEVSAPEQRSFPFMSAEGIFKTLRAVRPGFLDTKGHQATSAELALAESWVSLVTRFGRKLWSDDDYQSRLWWTTLLRGDDWDQFQADSRPKGRSNDDDDIPQ